MLTKQQVKHIAKLARLGITKKEEEKFAKELSAILDFFKELKKVETIKVEPCSHPSQPFLQEGHTLRDDEARGQTVEMADKLVKAAPAKIARYVKVKPPVVQP